MKKILSLITILLVSFIGISQTNFTNFEKQVIIAPKAGYETQFIRFIGENNLKVLQEFKELGWYLVELPVNETQDGFIDKYKSTSSISKIYKDEFMEYTREFIPNDVSFGSQWYLKQFSDKDIDADLAWDSIPSDNAPVTVAVFDGGIDITHEDLVGNIVTPFNAVTNAYSNGELVDPLYDRHGTSCSGTIAAVTNNALGVASVGNNKVKVMPVNIMTYVTSGGNFGTSTTIQLNAINAAMANNCVGISMSYSGSAFSQALSDAFLNAKTNGRGGKGIFMCASTGNDYSATSTRYPANYVAVYGIGATTSNDVRANYSNYGNIVDISGPGSTIQTTDLTGANGYSTGNYASVSGTSFSCPITTAAGAVLIYKNPNLTEAQVMAVLAQTADKVGGYTYALNANYPFSTRSIQLGYGRINLASAVNAVPLVGNPIDNPPTLQHNFTLTNCSVSSLSANIGATVTLNTTQRTQFPSLDPVAPKVQYRFSNDNIWSADDIVIGSDTSNIGGQVELELESINFTVPATATLGTKYILIRANYDGAVPEITAIDNTCSVSLVITNPGSTGLDLRVFWINTSVVTCGNNTSPAGGAVGTTNYKFQNTGAIPITSFTAKSYWENCPWVGLPALFNCTVNSMTYSTAFPYNNQILQPNAFSSTWQFTACLASCPTNNPSYNVLNVGETRNLIVEILTVNGLTGDDFSGNNKSYLPVTRTSCNTAVVDGQEIVFDPETGEEIIDEPVTNIYTITGVLVDGIPFDQLASGIYIVRTTFSDGNVETRKIFK